jgi:guanylate kinase
MVLPEIQSVSYKDLIPNSWQNIYKSADPLSPELFARNGFEGASSFIPLEGISHAYVQEDSIGTVCQLDVMGVYLDGASGSGKDSMIKLLEETYPHTTATVVTATDRPKRDTETDGIDQYFKTQMQFDRMIENDELLEYASTRKGYRFGIPKSSVEEAKKQAPILIFRITNEGIQTSRPIIETMFPTVSIAILPERSLLEYHDFLCKLRAGENPEDRFRQGLSEIENIFKKKYGTNYIITNPPDPSGKPHEATNAFASILNRLQGK